MLIEEVARQQKPLLAICRGHQILNVALGKFDCRYTLTDAAGQEPLSRTGNQVVHDVKCTAGSLMEQIAGKTRLDVNSTHHQAVAQIAKPLRATAVSTDGIVESLELASEARGLLPYLLSVQIHPERLFTRHAEHLELFRTFVQACRRLRRSQV
jgi:putative glutamine amidotransferase